MKFWKPSPGEVVKILPTARQVGKSTNFATVIEWENINLYIEKNRPTVRKNSKKIFKLLGSLDKIKNAL